MVIFCDRIDQLQCFRYWNPSLITSFRLAYHSVRLHDWAQSFQNFCDIWCHFVWFGCQVAVCVKICHKISIFGWSCFQRFNFYGFLIKLLICSHFFFLIFSFVCPLPTQASDTISGTQMYFTLFLALSHKAWHKVKKFKKSNFYVMLFTQLFCDVEELGTKKEHSCLRVSFSKAYIIKSKAE